MADDQSKCSASETGESSDSTIQINVKSLDSQIYTFCVNKNVRLLLVFQVIPCERT